MKVKTKANFFLLISLIFVFLPFLVLAEERTCLSNQTSQLGICPEDYPALPPVAWDITAVIDSFADWFALIGGTAAVCGIIYAGIRYITAAGDTKKITDAKTVFKYALIGCVLIILSWGIVSFIEEVIRQEGVIPVPEL